MNELKNKLNIYSSLYYALVLYYVTQSLFGPILVLRPPLPLQKEPIVLTSACC